MNKQSNPGVEARSGTKLESVQKVSMNRAGNSCDLRALMDRWDDKDRVNPQWYIKKPSVKLVPCDPIYCTPLLTF